MYSLTKPETIALLQSPHPRRAVVIGASIAGLLTARVLADTFDSVVLVESDRLPKPAEARRGVPQSVQPHVLFAKGYRILEELFPGIGKELNAAGALSLDWVREFYHYGEGGWSQHSAMPSDIVSVTCSRPLLEWAVRQRVAALPQVQFLPQHQVTGLLAKPEKNQVTGIRLQPRCDAGAEELSATLIVDASGRRSAAPQWLTQLGWTPPPETIVNPYLGYATRRYRIPAAFKADWKVMLISQQPPHQKRLGYLARIEEGEWIATLGGYGRDFPPTDEAGFLEFARSLWSPCFYEAIKEAEAVSPIYAYRSTANRLRHYEQVQMPQGFVALGDAVCALCPVYGQGMTVAALSALVLREWLKGFGDDSQLPASTQFQKRLAQSNQVHWLVATGQDSRFLTTVGRTESGWLGKAMGWYMQRVLQGTSVDEELHLNFVEVTQALKSPLTLYHPKVMLRVVHSLMRQAG